MKKHLFKLFLFGLAIVSLTACNNPKSIAKKYYKSIAMNGISIAEVSKPTPVYSPSDDLNTLLVQYAYQAAQLSKALLDAETCNNAAEAKSILIAAKKAYNEKYLDSLSTVAFNAVDNPELATENADTKFIKVKYYVQGVEHTDYLFLDKEKPSKVAYTQTEYKKKSEEILSEKLKVFEFILEIDGCIN